MLQLPKPRNEFDRLAFFGPMCAGKTTAAKILVKDYGYTRIAFADSLKALVIDLFGLDVSVKNDYVRKVLQEFSDDCKKWDQDLWIKRLLEKISFNAKVVVDDLRYKREADVLVKNDFKLILIDCPGSVRWQRIVDLYPDTRLEAHTHASEQEWQEIQYHYVISGEGYRTQYDLDELIMFHRGKIVNEISYNK